MELPYFNIFILSLCLVPASMYVPGQLYCLACNTYMYSRGRECVNVLYVSIIIKYCVHISCRLFEERIFFLFCQMRLPN